MSHTSAYRLVLEPCLPFNIIGRQEFEWNLLLHQDGGDTSSASRHIVRIKFEDHCGKSGLEVRRLVTWISTTVRKIAAPSLYPAEVLRALELVSHNQ